MATTLEKIKTLLSRSNKAKTYKVKMYAEVILDDGRIIATEDEVVGVGSEVYVISEDGEAFPLEAGSYTLEDGTEISIDEGSVVSSYGEEVVEEEAEVEEEMADCQGMEDQGAEIVDEVSDTSVVDEVAEKINSATPDEVTEEISKEIAQTVVDHLVSKVEDAVDGVEEEVEEMKEEDAKEETEEELSSDDVLKNITERLETIESKLMEFESQEGAHPIIHSPEGTFDRTSKKEVFSKVSRQDVLNMTTNERVAFMIQNKITKI